MEKNFSANRPIGIQLWTLKDEMSKDALDTIRKVADIGYQKIELYEGEKGILWGQTSKEFINLIEDLGLKVTSAHCDPFYDFEKKVDEALSIGLEYLVCPWLGPNPSLDFYKKALDRFNYCANYCFEHGLKFAYHNHDYSLKPVEGVIPHELFLSQTDPNKMFFEIDIYWVVVAGQDPLKWLKDYPDRWPLMHLKDLAKKPVESQSVSCVIGEGSINYRMLIPKFINAEVKEFYLEQEYFSSNDPLADTIKGFQFLKSL